MLRELVPQQPCFDEYRAIQSVQEKAWVAGNGRSLVKIHNAVLNALGRSAQDEPESGYPRCYAVCKASNYSLQSAFSG